MNYTQNELHEMIRKARIASVATIAENVPKVRCMDLWFIDDTGLYFQSTDLKALSVQIETNQNVEAVFYLPSENPDNPTDFRMIRVEAEAEILDDEALVERAFNDRPWLKDIEEQMKAQGVDGGRLFIFRLKKGHMRCFDMSYNCRESMIPVVSICSFQQ